MGLTNEIRTKEDIKCPKCKESLRYKTEHPSFKNIISFQSKDMSDRCNVWYVGDKIIIEDGGLKFIAEGNDIWTGCSNCPHCRTFFECDIIIKKGVITAIENLREYEY